MAFDRVIFYVPTSVRMTSGGTNNCRERERGGVYSVGECQCQCEGVYSVRECQCQCEGVYSVRECQCQCEGVSV